MNENRIYLLYRTDEHLMADSKELLFIGSLKSCIAASLCYNATENQKKTIVNLRAKSVQQHRKRVHDRKS